jgi:hypothetical protein
MSRMLCLGIVACGLGACTPLRSTITPPYVIDGVPFSADELEGYALEQCQLNTQGAPPPPHRFTTDGCSAYRDARWRGCCIKHDVAYWCGALVRREADQEFRDCVRSESSALNAGLMYTGVRLGGGRFAPFPWRYGYGYPWPHRKPAEPSETRPQNALTRP